MSQDEPSPDPPAPPKSVPGIVQSIALGALFYGVLIAIALTIQFLSGFAGLSLDMFSSLLIEQMIAWPIALWVGLRWSKASFREACPLTPFPVRIVPALLVASYGASIVLLAFASLIPMPEEIRTSLVEGIAGSSKLAMFFSVVVVAPLAEELFFRGLVLRGYLGRYSVTKSVWISALFFAVFHLNPWQGVAALPLGIGFAWLALRTGSLVPGMICHAAVNFSNSFLIAPLGLMFGYDAKAWEALGNLPPSIVAIGAVMAGVGGLVLGWQLRLPVLCLDETAAAPQEPS